MTIHATAVAVGNGAVLLRGSSGAGKSDVALRLLTLPPVTLIGIGYPEITPCLIADDRVVLEVVDGRLLASAPASLRGRLELRGLGIIPIQKVCDRAVVRLVVDLQADVPRLPEPQTTVINGIGLPLIALRPFDASTPLKIALALLVATGQSEKHQPE